MNTINRFTLIDWSCRNFQRIRNFSLIFLISLVYGLNALAQDPPPQEAITACNNATVGKSCSFQSPQGMVSGTCTKTSDNRLACAPTQPTGATPTSGGTSGTQPPATQPETTSTGTTSGTQPPTTTPPGTTPTSGTTTQQPPQEAITACNTMSSGSSCSFQSPQGTVSGTCLTTSDNHLACVPTQPTGTTPSDGSTSGSTTPSPGTTTGETSGTQSCATISTVTSGQDYPIVDTHQTLYYGETSTSITCPKTGESFYGQDAHYSGNQPSYTDHGDGTVTDNVTGLMWQQDPDFNGDGVIDSNDKKTPATAIADAATFNLAGYTDWRLPTIKELYSLIDFSGSTGTGNPSSNNAPADAVPYLNTDYFKFEYGDANAGERYIDAQYWSSTKYVSTTMNGDTTYFGVNFADGRIKGYGIGTPERSEDSRYVRYVRGKTNYGENDFVDNNNETITDNATGLMWMKSDSGSFSNLGTYQDGSLNWEEALAWCETLDHAGYSDWRLPNAKELQSLVDYTRSPDTTNSAAIDPLFNATYLPNGINDSGTANYPYYWTGTTHLDGTNFAVYVAFGEAQGHMDFGDGLKVYDVHGAGAQRSSPKSGDPADIQIGQGPQGDIVSIYNYARCVRNVATSSSSPPLGGASAEDDSEESPVLSGQLSAATTTATENLVEISDPVKGHAIVLSKDSQPTSSHATKFKAGLSVGSATPKLMAKAKKAQSFIFNATITVDPVHVGQQADLVMVVGAEMKPPFEGDEDTVYAMVNDKDEFVHVDLYQPQSEWSQLLVPFKTGVTLASDMVLTPRQSQFDMAGKYYFFVGYRLASGNVIYNPAPVMLEVTEEEVEATVSLDENGGLAGSSTTSDPTVCVYQHSSYGGWEKCYTTSQSSFSSLGIDNAVSSIKVSNGAIAILYNDSNYGGTSYVYDANSTSVTANDAASSLKIFDSSSPVVCLYQNSSYGGWGTCASANTSSLSSLNINDAASSVKVHGDAIAVLYDDASYSGTSYVYDANSTSLTSNDKASSLKIFDKNDSVVCLYQHVSYSGWGKCFDENVSNFKDFSINDAVSSVKVHGDAVATLYKDADYSNTSSVYSYDVASVEYNDTYSSLKMEDSFTITQLNVDGQSGDELVIKILNPDGSGYLIYEPLAVAHFLKAHGISIDSTFVSTLSSTQLDALIQQNTGVTVNTQCLSGLTAATSSADTAVKINAALGTSSDGYTATASGTYGAYEFESAATLSSSGLSLSFAASCTLATWSDGTHTITISATSANAEYSVSKNGFAIGAEVSAISVTYTVGDTDDSYLSLGASAGIGANFGAKWGQKDQYGVTLSIKLVSVSVYVSGSDATTAYNESKVWILDTSGTVVNTTEDTATYVWNESSDWAKNASGDIQVFYHNGVDDIEVGYKKASSTVTLWVSDATGTVSMTLVNSTSAISTALSQVGSTMSSTTTAVTTTLSSWAKSTTSVVSKVANSVSDTLESAWSTFTSWF